jgi:DNA sulfur modification protein DndB
MDKGAALNKRVWTLFEKAGFETQPNSQSNREFEISVSSEKKIPVDLYARESQLDVTIIGSNKSGGLGRWTEHVTNYKELGRKAGADKVLFVVTGTELDEKERKHVFEEGMQLWTEDELSYYEALADAIGAYAKYEIIHALGLRTSEEKGTHRVLALRLRQPTTNSQTELFLFTVCPEWLLKTCVIYRKAMGNADAYQRMLRKNRLPKIRKFVAQPDSMLPTNIIVHLADNVTVDEVGVNGFRDTSRKPITLSRSKDYDLVTLNIPMEYASMELIDGQHRLYGFAGAEAATKRDFNLVVLGVRGLTVKQRRDAFVAINDNSRRMDANLVAYLKYTDNDSICQKDSELMAIRIVVDLNGATPFKKAIKLLDVGQQKITLKGFSGYDLKGLLGPRGLLRKYYLANAPEEYVRVLRMYFGTIQSVFKKEWKNTDKYIIATNRGVSAFLKLLKSILKTEKAAVTQEKVREYIAALKAGSRTWEFEQLKKTYVGSQGWKEFHRDLVRVIKKKFSSFKE